MATFRVLSDAAVGAERDLLGFQRYVDPLVDVLTDTNADTPFTIGVFGAWGSGKSSLLTILDERLATDHPQEFVRVRFNPWFHRSESNMLVPLLHTLHDTLGKDMGHRFMESARKIGNVLLRLGADAILKKLTVDAVSLKSLEELEQSYLKERGKVESEIRRLRSTLQAEADSIADEGAKIVFFMTTWIAAHRSKSSTCSRR